MPAETRHIADIDSRHVLHAHLHAVCLGEDGVLDIVDLIAFGQSVAAAVNDETEAADRGELRRRKRRKL
jgi:hypothetical protein